MTNQKKPQGGEKGKGRAALKSRAAEVINGSLGYDADTRRAVWVALQNLNFAETNPEPPSKYTDVGYCERELREVLDKAAKGEPTFDESRHDPKDLAHARAVYALTEGSDVPDFIAEAVRVALEEAARVHRCPIWLDVDGSGDAEKGGYSIAHMSLLFRTVGVKGPEVEPKKDLAGHIAAVMNDPATPTELYNAMADELTTIAAKDAVTYRPEVLRIALALHAEEKRGES